MVYTEIFNRLWKVYAKDNPSVERIQYLLHEEGELIVNDHIAFRTFDREGIGLNVLEKPFLDAGYNRIKNYRFDKKKLRACHYEHITDEKAPKVFISELITSQCSVEINKVADMISSKIANTKIISEELLFADNLWQPLSYEIYNKLREESEYAAWFYVFGFRANHFTIFINYLSVHNTIVKLNAFLKRHGFELNQAGGEIKGSREQNLMQSSTMADKIEVRFNEGVFLIPCCYYEFAQRFHLPDGRLFSGFIADSANKIFESTDMYN